MPNETTHDVMVSQTEAVGNLIDYFQGNRDRIDADVASARAGFNALANDLKGVVKDIMYYNATLDETEANPTNVEGGVFNDLQTLINEAPVGATVVASMPYGAEYNVTKFINLIGRFLWFNTTGGAVGEKPVVKFHTFVSNDAADNPAYNNAYYINGFQSWGAHFHNVSAEVLPKVNVNLPWSSANSCFIGQNSFAGGLIRLSAYGSKFNFPVGTCLASPHVGGIISLGTYSCSVDGGGALAELTGKGVAMISNYTLTLLNASTVHVGGTVGQNLLLR